MKLDKWFSYMLPGQTCYPNSNQQVPSEVGGLKNIILNAVIFYFIAVTKLEAGTELDTTTQYIQQQHVIHGILSVLREASFYLFESTNSHFGRLKKVTWLEKKKKKQAVINQASF